tara:strand:+ start:8365 stop:8553 length:189 start_codon:yes stop_codon:yes gene_type:complete
MLLLLPILLAAVAYVIAGFIIACRTKNPVVRWGFGVSAALTLLALIFGAFVVFFGTQLPAPP